MPMEQALSDSWKISLPCTRDEAEMIAISADWDDGPTLVTTEVDEHADPGRAGSWRVDAYFAARPKKADKDRLCALLPSYQRGKSQPISAEKLADEDWTTLSQSGLEPIRAGRFHVHTPQTKASTDPQIRNFAIPAGLAFGTGHHQTTTGCLEMLDRMKRKGLIARSIIDIGTGTGLLAFAAMHLWSRAYATASDIDPLCGPVVAENAETNQVKTGQKPGALAMFIADGLDNAQLQRRAPYNLVIANILAAPLIELAPDIRAVMQSQGQLILAGLLNTQADAVTRAYRRQGFRMCERIVRDDWTILRLRKRGWE
jgi:ribosomal protein L11 methyltransferase